MTSAEASLVLAFVEIRSVTDKDIARGKKWYRLYSRFILLESVVRGDKADESYYHGQFDNAEEALYSLSERHEMFGVKFIKPYVARLLRDHTF